MTCENCKYNDVDYEWDDDYEEEIEVDVCRKGHEIDFALKNICSDFKKYKPKTLDMLDDSELSQALSTAVALCRNNDVEISDIIEKKVS